MLEIRNLTVTVGLKEIIKDLNFTANEGDKIAIIGEEGNGKSTLLKAIYGSLEYGDVKGTINKKGNTLGYLEQTLNDKDLEKSINEYLFKNEEDYYNKINDLYKILNDLSINEEILEREKMHLLSGGEKVKIQLLKILLDNPDILLLDEPTNDLDIDTLNWLEKFINNTNKPVIYVSHDETLLEKTANAILHLELLKKKSEPKYVFSKISYGNYVEKRLEHITKQTKMAKKEQSEYEKQLSKLTMVMNKVHHEQETITRADPHGGRLLKKKMKSIKSQEKRLLNKDMTEIPDTEESINLFFEEVFIPNKKEILKLDISNLIVDNKILSKNINLEIIGNIKIAIIGKNGVGKTTLLKYIYNNLTKRTDIKVGYMPQNYDEVLKQYNSPVEFLCNSHDKDEVSLVRSYLGNMKFTQEEMTGSINDLSGGSKAKLLLVKLIYNKCNVLILDEPTRNVSPLSNPVIREALKDFQGAVISISHDRKYIKEVCDKAYELTPDGLKTLDKETII